MKKYNFKNKVVWISGASSGIGESMAYAFAKLGARLILSARRENRLKEVEKRCKGASKTWVVPMDITDQNSIDQALEVVKGIGVLDILIQDAGIAQKGLVRDNKMEVDRSIMETNYFGTVMLTKAVLPIFLQQKQGWFAVVSSISGVIGVPGRSAYSASKHALHGFFESLRAEVYEEGIEVSIIMPGFVNTMITAKEMNPDGSVHGDVEKSHLLGMDPDECAQKIVEGLQDRDRNIIVGGVEISSVYVHRYMPDVYDYIVRNHPMKKWRSIIQTLTFNKKQQ